MALMEVPMTKVESVCSDDLGLGVEMARPFMERS